MKMDDVKELTQISGPEGTTTFAYDDWGAFAQQGILCFVRTGYASQSAPLGRMTSKSRSSYTADYTYGPMSMLWGVESDFPGEGDAAYLYGGDGKRRNRVTATDETWYNWAGWSVINEEDDADGTGNLTRWYLGRNGAHADGASPATGTWRYYTHDHLSSTRNVYDSSKNRLASYDYTPYGEVYASAAFPTANHTYTGHAWDTASGMYFAPFRHYAPGMGRWITPDPLGMVDGTNVYGYVGGNPVVLIDPFGLSFWGCFGRGLVTGLVTGVVVVGVAAAAVTFGVPAAAVTGALFVAGVVGGSIAAYSIYNNPSADNIGYHAGGFAAGALLGGVKGGFSKRLSPPGHQPAPGLKGWSPVNDAKQVWKFNLSEPPGQQLANAASTGPNPLSGTGAIAAANSGAVSASGSGSSCQ